MKFFRLVYLPLLALFALPAAADIPTNNPTAQYKLAWTDEIHWTNALDVTTLAGADIMAKLSTAQELLTKKGGGVAYFPAGTYKITATILLKDGVIIRGASPTGRTTAQHQHYKLATIFEFPRFSPKLTDTGTPTGTAFKGIHLEHPGTASNCGVVDIHLNHGHIEYGRADDAAGSNRIVFGCILRHAAIAEPDVPAAFQHPWQRWTARHHAAVHVFCGENMLVANNRLPESDSNFEMKGFKLFRDRGNQNDIMEADVTFDYDFRPGIYANPVDLGGSSDSEEHHTPGSMPTGFRKGLVIRDNYIFCTGSPGIMFTGDGTVCSFNTIRFKKGVYRETCGGIHRGHFTNNIRAIEMRGWRWTVEGNDYEVYRNDGPIGPDGEGLMHKAGKNSTIKDSKLVNNTGNAYLCFWRVPVDGLLIKGNKIKTSSEHGAICILSRGRSKDKTYTVKNLTIEENTTELSGIQVYGRTENVVIRKNQHRGSVGNWINAMSPAVVEQNKGYSIVGDAPKKQG